MLVAAELPAPGSPHAAAETAAETAALSAAQTASRSAPLLERLAAAAAVGVAGLYEKPPCVLQ